MGKQLVFVAVAGLALAACGDDGGTSSTDTLGADVLVPSDTISMPDTMVGQDTLVAQDTLIAQDTAIAQDTLLPQDTLIAQDTEVPDTNVADTTIADTTLPDTNVADTTVADTTVPDTNVADTTTTDTVVGPTCGTVTLAGTLEALDGYPAYEMIGDFGVGDPNLPDVLSLEFYTTDVGTFDLATGNNANYATCDQCALIYSDYDEVAGSTGAVYFQSAGTMTFAAGPGSADFSVTLTGASFVEVEIDGSTYTSTPVTDGACLDSAGAVTLSTDTTVNPTECSALTVSGTLVQYNGGSIYLVDGEFAGDPSIPDVMTVEFYTSDVGSFDLGTGDNANYATCSQCVVVYADYDETNGPAATYFQRGGTLVTADGQTPGDADFGVTLTDLVLEEVTIDDTTYTSTPVTDGACYEMTGSATLATDTTPIECSALTLTGTLTQPTADQSYYEIQVDLGLGDPSIPELVGFEFYDTATGTFDLGTGDNADYATCTQCVIVLEDYDETNGPTAIYYQNAGTMTVDAATPPGGAEMTLTLTGLGLEQVDIDGTTYASTPVVGGACFDVADATLATAPVGPQCGLVTVSGDLTQYQTYAVYQVVGDFGVGDATADILSLEFYDTATGTFDLGTGDNTDYATCSQCVVLYADYDDTNGAAATYFQTAGSITVDAATTPGDADFNVALTDVSFTEVTIDSTTYASTPVEGGACYTMTGTTALAATAPACIPNCTDRVCGADGCGGVCGDDCAAGGTCHLDGSVCEDTPTCMQVTVGGANLVVAGTGLFRVDLSAEGAGAADLTDLLQLEFYTTDTGSFDLASGDNANYATCVQCVRAFLDIENSPSRQFFQTAGTLVVDAASDVSAGPAQVGITGLHLVEVTIDSSTYTSTPVAGGACIDVTVTPDLTTPAQ
ncbi:MAG: hypothetical protein EP329_25155 [Deltaproteobacteria bacterium]|nr:MAG: hypothetical protein EP329_25155 [Deltaproteobacteria bacterium]